MVKVRMNTADVAAEVKCLRKLIGMRCANVYDITPKTYMFKLMNSSGITESGESEKVLLLMESGVRLHTTQYVRDKSVTPSGFTLKLRKHIRTRRLEDVRQLGYDRIILFQFGLGANAHYVILELYAQGNIILADPEFMVLTLLRSHRDDDKGFAIMSRHRYPVEICRIFERTTAAKLEAALTASEEAVSQENCETNEDKSVVHEGPTGKQNKGGKSSVKKTSGTTLTKLPNLKYILGEALGYGPALSEHIILDADLLPNTKVSPETKLEHTAVQALINSVKKFEDWLEDIISGAKVPEGYILMQEKVTGKDGSASNKIYDEFCPLLLNQFKSRESVQFETFDAAVDEFYSKIESQRAEQQQRAKEDTATLKLNKIRSDQENRVVTLKKEVDRCVTMAELIEYNLEDVDAAILAVRVALANGMSWNDLARMVKDEKKAGNPVAGLIDKLHLERNCMTLLLSNNLDDMDDDEKTLPADKVEVDLALSAHANTRRWYEQKKKQESKQEKTITAHEKAFKAAERKTRLQLSQEKAVASISHMRKVHWFEKFNWFISSENYLVISGRDAQQNEMIVKRYMSKGDLYIHADLHGASSTVIKNHKPDTPVPPLTLNQAGCFTVCHSQAWDSKIITSAWWVYPHQVSKTAPTGEYLTVGSFMIRGKKNFLPPHPLIMGFGLLFRLDESSLGSHLNERRVRGEEDGTNEAEETGVPGDHSETDSGAEDETESHTVDPDNSPDKATSSPKLTPVGVSDTISSQNGFTATISEVVSKEVLDPDKSFSQHMNSNPSSSTGNSAPVVSSELDDLIDRALGLGTAAISNKASKDVSLSKYDTSHMDVSEENDIEESKGNIRDKPYISKAERRKLKKGLKDAGEQEITDSKKEMDIKSSAKSNLTEKKVQAPVPVGKVSRGQKGKLKKMKEKYADQDEEERHIRMALLASDRRVQKKDSEEQSESKPAHEEKKATTGLEDAPKICYRCKKVGHLSRDCPEHLGAATQSHDTAKVEDSPARHTEDDSKDLDRVVMEEDDIHEIGEEEKEKLNDIDYLTGNPLPTDILHYAVPVCGPYSALQSYKYRVKIVPGSAKRGKAAKSAMNLFSHMPEATIREKELMKACTDPELVAAIIGNVKITAAGLSQLKQKQKKSKKSSRKNDS
uniref:CCHC-type domain-containing protein n=1 Tax=Kalanchoe fedtschenkoi TaxID=63787 RepID=A0A7N1A1J9_KALFE